MIDYAHTTPTTTYTDTPPVPDVSNTPSVSVDTPVIQKESKLKKLKESFVSLFSKFGSVLRSSKQTLSSLTSVVFNRKSIGTLLFIGIVASAIILGVKTTLGQPTNSNQTLGATNFENDTSTVSVEREYAFSVYDKNKELADPIIYRITTAQLTKQIIIKGQRANAVKGRSFLIFNLKLVNNSEQSLFLNTRNYMRIQPAGSSDRLAFDIHNDTIEVQPLSTKITRIGLPVDENIKEFTVFVGELEGEKEEFVIKF